MGDRVSAELRRVPRSSAINEIAHALRVRELHQRPDQRPRRTRFGRCKRTHRCIQRGDMSKAAPRITEARPVAIYVVGARLDRAFDKRDHRSSKLARLVPSCRRHE